MRLLTTKPNTLPPNGTYPFGRIQDNNGSNNGTPISEQVYGDYHQFFEKMFLQSTLVANNLPDNATNGFQLFDALRKNINEYSNYTLVSGNVQLNSTHYGQVIINVSNSPVTINLPNSAAPYLRSKITVYNLSAQQCTVAPAPGEFLNPANDVLDQLCAGVYSPLFTSAHYTISRYAPPITTPANLALNGASWSTAFAIAQYLRTQDGIVMVRGSVTTVWSVIPSPTIVGNLPAGFRPTSDKNIPITWDNGSLPYLRGSVWVRVNGDIEFYSDTGIAIGSTVNLYLDSINFYRGW